jgi:VWFA-related protein
MGFCRRIALVWVGACGAVTVGAQAPKPDEPLRVTTQLVVLDATVLDKAGHVVMQPLGRDDFLIEEDKKPQTIYSFESIAEHATAAAKRDSEKAPQLIFVLDEMNYAYQPFHTNAWNIMEQLNQYVFERQELVAYLKDQPETLLETAEVLALTHHGFRILVQPTRDRGLLLERVSRHDPGLGSPFRDFIEQTGYGGSADGTSSKASLQGLWALALQQRSVPGRKVVVWLGIGGPEGELTRPGNPRLLHGAQPYQRVVTDVLVEARITLDVIGPGGDRSSLAVQPGAMAQAINSIRYESGFGFSGYIAATGGLRRNTNDVRGEIQASVNYGTAFYTLSYRPLRHDFNGEFRRIRVTVKGHPEWIVLTKAGYYAMQFGGEMDAEHQQVMDISIATFEPMPFEAIGVTLTKIERIKGTDKARFTFELDSGDLQWHADATEKKREADVAVSGAALGSVFSKASLASEIATWKLTVPMEKSEAPIYSEVAVTVRVPAKTQRLRFTVRDTANGRMGTVDLAPKVLESAMVVDGEAPALQTR